MMRAAPRVTQKARSVFEKQSVLTKRKLAGGYTATRGRMEVEELFFFYFRWGEERICLSTH